MTCEVQPTDNRPREGLQTISTIQKHIAYSSTYYDDVDCWIAF